MEILYKITPLLAGEYGPVSEKTIFRNGDQSKKGMVPSYVFYVKSDYFNIIVDTSFSSAQKCTHLTGMKCERDGTMISILKSHGIDPLAVDTVIWTHLHWDHAGNGMIFPNAKIICQRDELSWALAPPSWEPGYSIDFSKEIVEVIDRIEAVDGSAFIHEGIEVVKLGGHSAGSQAVIIDSDIGKVIIPGDLVMNRRNLDDAIPIGLFVNLYQCIEGIQWLKSQNAVVLPSHDWDLLNPS